MSNKANKSKSFNESIESVSKDIRYRKALVERYYFNNHGNYIAYYGYETVLHVKMTLFMLSCIWIGYTTGLFLHYSWKDSSDWSYIETWAIYYVLSRIGYVYGYNTENWLRRVELGNYDKSILNEPGSSNDNPIDLTVEETATAAATETQDEATSTQDEVPEDEATSTQDEAPEDEASKDKAPEDKAPEDEATSTQDDDGIESVEI